MKINAMIKRLERLRDKHGNLEVFYDGEVGPTDIADMYYVVADENEYPVDWDMPEGTKFVLLS